MVRRSATICLFSKDDGEMIRAKTGNWFNENPQRARSNNSAVLERETTTKEEFEGFIDSIKEYGEPGIVFSYNKEHLYNPCVEIGLMGYDSQGNSGWQSCNLSEINGGVCTDKETFFRCCKAAAILGTLQAGYTDFKFLGKETTEIVEREALIGVSITGWMNNPSILFDEDIMCEGAKIVRETNKHVATLIGINSASRTTTVKPSGNASVILGTSSGIHGEHSPSYIRNVQMNKDSEVAKAIREQYPLMIEDSVWSSNGTDYCISFPVVSPKDSIFKDQLYGVKQLEYVKKAQTVWVEEGTNVDLCVDEKLRHNVSNTITVDDWDAVSDYVWENRDHFCGISFIPMSGDRDYQQAPFTTIKSFEDIGSEYGNAALYASGLIGYALEAFEDNLWNACDAASYNTIDMEDDSHKTLLKRDFVRRLMKFSKNWFDGDLNKTIYCLKDVYLLHKWDKLQNSISNVDWDSCIGKKEYTEAGSLTAQACSGGSCEIEF